MKRTILLAAVLTLCTAGAYALEKNVAVVNGKNVASEELTKKLWWQYGAQGLSELIDEKLLLEEAARLGLKADPKEVEAKVNGLMAGYTDKAQFEKNLKAVGWSTQDLRDLVRRQILVRETVMKNGKVSVTDEDAKTFFDKNKDKFVTQESVKLSQIFVNTRSEADDAALALSAGADFTKLSELKSTDPNLKRNKGSLGYISKGMLIPEIEKEIFALKPGQYSKVLNTGNGFSIFRAEERKAAQDASFPAVKDELKTALVNQAISQKLPEITAELRQRARIEVLK